jgi:peptidoglycan LD-endopeptidase LytH
VAPPPSGGPGPSSASPATPSTGGYAYTFPVDGKVSYARTHHDYPATDIIAACGLPVRAVVDGTVLEVTRVDVFDKATSKGEDRGGLSVSLLGVDGVRYYGSHLSSIAAGIDAGVVVKGGAQLGLVGKTGNANNTCHLHFGISPPCASTGDWWIRRGVLYPWKYLDSWKGGQLRTSPAADVAQWHDRKGCPAEPKS